MQEELRKFRKALDLSMDGIQTLLNERKDLNWESLGEGAELESIEAEIVLKFRGTKAEIRSKPRIEPGSPEPTNVAQVV